jgi:hypothetical protein
MERARALALFKARRIKAEPASETKVTHCTPWLM